MNGNLHDEFDGFRLPGDRAPVRLSRSVQALGTTANRANPKANSEPLGSPEWLADLEYVWRHRMAPVIAKLDTRARKRRRQAKALGREADKLPGDNGPRTGAWLRVGCLRSAEWAEERARALAMPRADILATCGERWRTVRCGCRSLELKVGCDNPTLCASCRKRHARKWKARITESMAAALVVERAAYHATPSYRRRGYLPGIYLITLTAPHSGDLAVDRDVMGRGVRALLNHAGREGWWRTYALTWEATAGDDGKGHLHAHLAVISSWIPYTAHVAVASAVPSPSAYTPRRRGERRAVIKGLHEVWRDAMPGALVLDVQAPKKGANAAASAGEYLAKYVTKGVDPSEFTGQKAGELLVALRGKRKVTTSAHFWRARSPECEHCKVLWRSAGAPVSLKQLMPGAWMRAQHERMMVEPGAEHRRERFSIPRGSVQVALRWDSVVRCTQRKASVRSTSVPTRTPTRTQQA